MRKLRRVQLLLLLAIMFGLAGLAGCEREGPAEQTGEEIDRTIEDMGDQIEEQREE